MTLYEAFVLMLTAATLVAVTRSLIAVQQQVRLMGEQTGRLADTVTMSAEGGLDSLFTLVTRAYLDFPELRAVFSPEEKPPPRLDRANTLRAQALAECLCDAMERGLIREFAIAQTAPTLRNWVEDSMRGSDFLREWLLGHDRWYGNELVAIARAAAHP